MAGGQRSLPWALALAVAVAPAIAQHFGPVGIATQEPDEVKPRYPEGLLAIKKGGEAEVDHFVGEQMEPRHAVAVGITGKGSKRHKLLQDLADDSDLYGLIALGVQFRKGGSSLVVHQHGYPPVPYDGKWTRGSIKDWLLGMAFPLVNRLQAPKWEFPIPKYLVEAPFGTVLVVRPPEEQSDELVRALEPFAEQYRDRLKFSFFHRDVSDPNTKKLCEIYGVWSSDELVLNEKPREQRTPFRRHSHAPTNPKYLLRQVTPERVRRFFEGYAAGTWPRYYKSDTLHRPARAPVDKSGIRELSGWDFVEVVNDPTSAVLVGFVSRGCDACETFMVKYRELARMVADARKRSPGAFRNLVLARINQTDNEHSETIKVTPHVRYWPRGSKKRTVDLESLSADAVYSFLEERTAEEIANLADDSCEAGSGPACNSK